MKIGIYRLCGLGDLVQLTPLFQQIKADYPKAEIVFFTSSNAEPLLKGNPWISKIGYQKLRPASFRECLRGNFSALRFFRQYGPYDYFLNFAPQFRDILFSAAITAKSSFVFSNGRFSPFWITYARRSNPEIDYSIHMSEIYLSAWSALTNCPDLGYAYSLSHLRVSGKPRDHVVGLAIGAGNERSPGQVKRWPIEHWRQLGALLNSAGYIVHWFGSDADATNRLDMSDPNNHIGRTDLSETVRLLQQCDLVVAADTGLLHIASALGIPTLGLFGPTSSAHLGPYRDPYYETIPFDVQFDCSPCWRSFCQPSPSASKSPYPLCLASISAEKVHKIIQRRLPLAL